jgi:hypothetical protein
MVANRNSTAHIAGCGESIKSKVVSAMCVTGFQTGASPIIAYIRRSRSLMAEMKTQQQINGSFPDAQHTSFSFLGPGSRLCDWMNTHRRDITPMEIWL